MRRRGMAETGMGKGRRSAPACPLHWQSQSGGGPPHGSPSAIGLTAPPRARRCFLPSFEPPPHHPPLPRPRFASRLRRAASPAPAAAVGKAQARTARSCARAGACVPRVRAGGLPVLGTANSPGREGTRARAGRAPSFAKSPRPSSSRLAGRGRRAPTVREGEGER